MNGPRRAHGRRRIVILLTGGLCLCGLLWLAAWFLQNFERVEEAGRTVVPPEARRNPFLAAELFLRASGVLAESGSGRARLHELPPVGDVLLIDKLNIHLGERHYQALLDWIRAGGHLITTAARVWDEGETGHHLLNELGVTLMYQQRPEDMEEGPLQNPIEVRLEPDTRLMLNFNPAFTLLDQDQRASAQFSGEHGAHLLQIPLQGGLVTIVSDNRFLRSPLFAAPFDRREWPGFYISIAEADHAYYLLRLTAGAGKVWLLYGLQTRGLGPLLWQKARLACLSLALLVIIGLWAERNRFGPYFMPVNRPRRNYLEHIKMTADFCWQQDRGQHLFDTNRRRFRHWLSLKHPRLSTLPEQEQCQRLAEYTGIAAGKIRQALFGAWQTEPEFIRLTHTLQSLREKL